MRNLINMHTYIHTYMLYIYINRHAGTSKQGQKHTMDLVTTQSFIVYYVMGLESSSSKCW